MSVLQAPVIEELPGSRLSSLIIALDHPNPITRYEAAAAIAGYKADSAFAGSPRVHDRWMQTSRLGQQGSTVVLENRPEFVSGVKRLMKQAGLDAVFVQTARQLDAYASTGNDIRLIISRREPKDVTATELVEMVRRNQLTRDVPLLIYKDPVSVSESTAIGDSFDDFNARETLATSGEAVTVPDRFRIIGGLDNGGRDNIEGVIEKKLLNGNLDIDSTTRRELDLQAIGQSRWENVSLRAGLIREMVRPRSVAGLYELLVESRRRQHLPPLSPIDRSMYRRIAQDALDALDAR
jgi:hypothetical protein